MFFPLVPLVGSALAELYYIPKLATTIKYWEDYRKNTGYTPRYPMLQYGQAMQNVGSAFSQLKRF